IDRRELDWALSSNEPEAHFYLDLNTGKIRKTAARSIAGQEDYDFVSHDLAKRTNFVPLPKHTEASFKELVNQFAGRTGNEELKTQLQNLLKEKFARFKLNEIFFEHPDELKRWKSFLQEKYLEELSGKLKSEGLTLQLA
ncbi:MAG: UPF0158 family protein, partial [candidate division Zixibacteria bacterium]|nr:UPF0158 family protein [candidate division Zixibacteria bacterium]